jgi:hypothetical protein
MVTEKISRIFIFAARLTGDFCLYYVANDQDGGCFYPICCLQGKRRSIAFLPKADD